MSKTDQNRVVTLYAAFIAALLLQWVPVMAVQVFSLLSLLLVIGAIEFFRIRADRAGLLHNHAQYLSRTFWIGSIIMTIGAVAGGYYLFTRYGDQQALMGLLMDMSSGQMRADDFSTLVTIAIFAFGPGVLYMAYRIARGFARAVKGYRIANPKAFL